MRFNLLRSGTHGSEGDANNNFRGNVPQIDIIDISEVITLEGLKRTYNSCSNCGVCWYEDHVTLDCIECGGYAMQRPCPTCNGQCGSIWRRNGPASKRSKEARWSGSCSQWNSSSSLITADTPQDINANCQDRPCLNQTLKRDSSLA